ncbi:MAG: hypothetical protein J6J31_00395 [Thermoguttaceae bacterium]|nr:hypothetical protein [Thermoguttaceae bacterium]
MSTLNKYAAAARCIRRQRILKKNAAVAKCIRRMRVKAAWVKQAEENAEEAKKRRRSRLLRGLGIGAGIVGLGGLAYYYWKKQQENQVTKENAIRRVQGGLVRSSREAARLAAQRDNLARITPKKYTGGLDLQAESKKHMEKQIAEHAERLGAARAQHELVEAGRRAQLQAIQRKYHALRRQADARAAVQKDPSAVVAEQMVARLGARLPQITDEMRLEEKARIAAAWDALPGTVDTWLSQLSQARNEEQIRAAYKQLFAGAYSDLDPDLDKLHPAVDGVDAEYRFSPYGYLPTLIHANRERLAQAGIEQEPFEHVPGTTYATSAGSLPYNIAPDSLAYSDPLGHYEGRLEANRTVARYEAQAKEQRRQWELAETERAARQKREAEARAKLQQEVLENSKHKVQLPKPIVRPEAPIFQF